MCSKHRKILTVYHHYGCILKQDKKNWYDLSLNCCLITQSTPTTIIFVALRLQITSIFCLRMLIFINWTNTYCDCSSFERKLTALDAPYIRISCLFVCTIHGFGYVVIVVWHLDTILLAVFIHVRSVYLKFLYYRQQVALDIVYWTEPNLLLLFSILLNFFVIFQI